MNRVSLLCVLTFFLIGVPQSLAQGEQSPIPAEIYRGAGLAKLTDAERKVLYDWLTNDAASVRQITAPSDPKSLDESVAATTPSDTTTRPPLPRSFLDAAVGSGSELNSRIVSDFSGWTGRTIFVLENGETWQQRMDGEYSYSGSDTRVVISRGFMGLYRMELVATGRWIGVRRIK